MSNDIYSKCSEQAEKIKELEVERDQLVSKALYEMKCAQLTTSQTKIEELEAALHIAKHNEQCTHNANVNLCKELAISQARKEWLPDVDWLSNVIRTVDGNNTLGAGLLAEKILEAITQHRKEIKWPT